MKTNNRLMKHATGLAAALIAVALAWAPVPALAEIGEIAGVDDWTSIVQGDEADDSGLDVLAVTGTEGDRVWVDVTLNGNKAQLERLVSVLVENASKYVTENGAFRLTLRKGTRYTEMTVFNTCETDPDVNYSHLFDRFYRPDSSRTSSTGGHGIGLSIAKRIVTLHGGSIEAIPTKEGLSFKIKLSNKLKVSKQKGSEA